MICFVGLAVFAVLGIFSATYRSYTLDALKCMKDKASRNPCSTGFDEKYKAWSVDNAMKLDMRLASFVNNYFRELNWIIFFLMLLLGVYTLEAAYYLIEYGTCDPYGGCSIEEGWRWLT